jgi:hypothetical protein
VVSVAESDELYEQLFGSPLRVPEILTHFVPEILPIPA